MSGIGIGHIQDLCALDFTRVAQEWNRMDYGMDFAKSISAFLRIRYSYSGVFPRVWNYIPWNRDFLVNSIPDYSGLRYFSRDYYAFETISRFSMFRMLQIVFIIHIFIKHP